MRGCGRFPIMPLDAGTRIGPYEIIAPLGAGGMGEVYRARDTRLERDVAIKSLPAAFAADAERLARFEREAKTLAALNHPGIASIYGLEDGAGGPLLVLELVEGESLAQRLGRGALSARETLETGVKIAAALEAAHERGIVHRDLKPGNVMLAASGAVKVLDFGLAKSATREAVSSPDLSASPTVALSATGVGTLLGTAAYMSPEQARGKAVDRRTDVWAFGCVLYECLAGRQAFAGETASDVIARILEREPDWSAMPAATPTRLHELVRRSLIKDPAERPRDIGDLGRELGAMLLEMSSPSGISAAAPSTPSLAVLYFENLASDAESEYFCAGITEDILTDLSKIKGLRVASRNAVARYRGAPVDIPRVASDLGVGAVLEGSVRRAGDRVRITAQLINVADGFHLWAERYDRKLADVFDVQEEIASSIAAALRVALTPAESQKLVQNRPNDAQAYDLYLKGRQAYAHYTAESLREALDLFQQATRIDPDYALAWAGMADTYGQMCQWGMPEHEKLIALGLEAARRAKAIDPKLAEAHKAEGLVLRFGGDTPGSKAALLRAIEANPRYTPALINLAVATFIEADLAGTERLVRRALEIDPQEAFATTWLVILTMYTGRDEECGSLLDRLRKLSDDPFYITAVHFLRARRWLLQNDLDAAGRSVREGLAEGAQADNMKVVETAIAARTGRPDEARRLLAELMDVPNLGSGSVVLLAGTAVRLGDVEAAVRLLGRTIIRDLASTFVRLDPDASPLADHPPFAPRRRDATLVWPLEAPMIDAVRYRMFSEVKIATGIPEGSDVFAT
jgi:serine/threonine protein kinase/Tfp pilus assembly protein PilF